MAGDGAPHRGRQRLCFALDIAIRLLVMLILLAIITGIAWKALAPFPPWMSDSN